MVVGDGQHTDDGGTDAAGDVHGATDGEVQVHTATQGTQVAADTTVLDSSEQQVQVQSQVQSSKRAR